jgi:ectoine hydroxylase-related dioxygenase (phytanoyl-CoA dioxygenase family)
MIDIALQLGRDGAEQYPGFVSIDAIGELQKLLSDEPQCAGVRLFGNGSLSRWLVENRLLDLVSHALDAPAHPVRAILFDKHAGANWALGWHQDRTIAVRSRSNEPGFSHWTTKAGVQHVEPPFWIIERMVTARIHIDPVRSSSAPLLIAPGSHRLGRISEAQIEAVVDHCGTSACLAEIGDVWLYGTAILHASERSVSSNSRRVLQIDFSADALPGALEWLGIG